MIIRGIYDRWISPQQWMERVGLRAPIQITAGLVMLTVCVVLLAKDVGLLPTEEEEELRRRAMIAEVASVQAAAAISGHNYPAIQAMLDSMVSRNHGILSAGLRRKDGSMAMQTSGHLKFWTGADSQRSTPTHIQVPLRESNRSWGSMEIAFDGPVAKGTWWNNRLGKLIIFVAGATFLLFWFFLSRMLTVLDPSAVIPDRMQLLMDTLVEGMVILDARGQIVMTNQAFALTAFTDIDHLIGKKLSSMPWQTAQGSKSPEHFPWEAEQNIDLQQRGIAMQLQVGTKHSRRLNVNVSPIVDSEGKQLGKVLTFDDQTILEEDHNHLTQIVSEFGTVISQMRERGAKSEPHTLDPIEKLDELARAAADLTLRCRSAIEEGQQRHTDSSIASNISCAGAHESFNKPSAAVTAAPLHIGEQRPSARGIATRTD